MDNNGPNSVKFGVQGMYNNGPNSVKYGVQGVDNNGPNSVNYDVQGVDNNGPIRQQNLKFETPRWESHVFIVNLRMSKPFEVG
jgi:hypothetical protein